MQVKDGQHAVVDSAEMRTLYLGMAGMCSVVAVLRLLPKLAQLLLPAGTPPPLPAPPPELPIQPQPPPAWLDSMPFEPRMPAAACDPPAAPPSPSTLGRLFSDEGALERLMCAPSQLGMAPSAIEITQTSWRAGDEILNRIYMDVQYGVHGAVNASCFGRLRCCARVGVLRAVLCS